MSEATNIGRREFPGAKVIATDRPLFCRFCDRVLAIKFARAYDAGCPIAELAALLNLRSSAIVERIWPDRREWACHRCGREVQDTLRTVNEVRAEQWRR